MDALLYIKVLEGTLLPFLRVVYPDGHPFMADNDPKLASKTVKIFFQTMA